ncbi:MAG: ABC transporter permease [Alphaproteobacteria bacterium]|nr:ABC transporter permease [Alphaproteobacteria bacterium]
MAGESADPHRHRRHRLCRRVFALAHQPRARIYCRPSDTSGGARLDGSRDLRRDRRSGGYEPAGNAGRSDGTGAAARRARPARRHQRIPDADRALAALRPPLSRNRSVSGLLAPIGRAFLDALAALGRLALFAGTAIGHMGRPPFYPRLIARQMIEIGYFSLPVVALTTLFSGMVLALQSYTGFARFSAESAVATVVVLSMTRELAPVLAGLMVAGRVGAAMAAEIGTMRVTEQIDALTVLSTDPYKYLVVPRLIAGATMLPLLVLVGDIIGVFGGYLVSVYKLDFNAAGYLRRTWDYLEMIDVVSGLVKAGAFGFLVALTGCYHGYHSKGGAQGVGQATTNAVVSASILILVFNYIITEMFFAK